MDNLNLDKLNLDLSALDNLTPAERELAFLILKEYSETGESKKHSELIYDEYAEVPVDILTFVDDYHYLGNAWHDVEGNSKLYPYWREELLKIFPDNLTTKVNNGIFSGSRGRGKAQPLDSLVFTETGYKRMGDIKVGDKVYGSDGELHQVLGVFPQGLKPTYRVEFSDKSSCECSDEHLWYVRDSSDQKWKTLELKDIIKNKSIQYSIPITKPLNIKNLKLSKSQIYGYLADILNDNYKDIDIIIKSDIRSRCLFTELIQQNLNNSRLNKKLLANKSLFNQIKLIFQSLGKLIHINDSDIICITNNPNFRDIVNIEYLGEKECQCIYIDSDDHLYLTDDLIVTHNTEIAILIAAYLLHRLLCMKDPVAHFRLKPTEKIVFAFMNIKLALAEEIGVAKFQNTIQSSPWFMEHGELEGRTKKLWVPKKFNDQEAIDIKIGSQADDLIGLPIYFAFFDEVSFQRNQDVEKQKQKANDMIDTAIGGMKTRFVHKGKNPTFLALASSKRSDKSFLEEHMKKKLKSEKDNVYISDGPVWEVKPKGTYSDQTFRIALGNKFLQSMVIPDGDPSEPYLEKGYKIIEAPIDFRADFLDDIDRALCDFAGISSSSITKYINGAAVTDIKANRLNNPFVRDVLEIGNGPEDIAQYYDFFDITKIDPALRHKPLFIHMDMSLSGDKTGIAGTFIRGKKEATNIDMQSADLFFSLAFSVSIKAPKGRQVSFEKNRNFIRWLKRQGFNIKGVTTDTYQSADTGQQLAAEGYPYSVLSVDRVDSTSHICKPYQYLRTTIYEKRLEIYDSKLLIQELTELERNMDTGKVDHPDGGSKDAADAVCGSIYNASFYAEKYAYDYGESSEALLRANEENGIEDAYQIALGMEDELKRMSGFMQNQALVHPSDADTGTYNYSMYDDIIIL